MSEERLQKLLARAGIASRRASETLIREGRVTVNGAVASIGDRADPSSDAIKVDGRRVTFPEGHRYLVLNKPKGYITTRSDPEGRPTVMDLVPQELRRRLMPVGRLDFHTEGLLLMTTDGEFAQRIAHPSFGCRKTYAVKVKGAPDEGAIARLRRGMTVAGRRTRPARVQRIHPQGARSGANTWWSVELGEGRTRQIREMFFRVGHPVMRLRRVGIGSLRDNRLAIGEWRELTPGEVDALMAGDGDGRKRRRRPRRES